MSASPEVAAEGVSPDSRSALADRLRRRREKRGLLERISIQSKLILMLVLCTILAAAIVGGIGRLQGRSIVVLAKEKFNIRGRELLHPHATFVHFTAQTRMSGVDIEGRSIRKGAAGFDITFLHPKANEEFPIGGEGVLIELVQAPAEVVKAFAALASNAH